MQELPVDVYLPRIRDAVRAEGVLVLVAEPGAGKTTRVPLALSDDAKRVVCVQPRRVAASHAALRVCDELSERVGGRVGYAVRFDSKQSKQTKVLYVTTGVFMRMLSSGQGLSSDEVVVLDEFHERSADIDIALCACVAARQGGQGPALVVMSATLDAARLSTFLGATALQVPGRLHPIEVEYLPPRPRERPAEHIARATRNLLVRSKNKGERLRSLVFVPGRAEMRAGRRAVELLSKDFSFETAELFGAQAFSEQKAVLRARRADEKPQIIFATRVAETSLTVPDLNAVVDTGLSRSARVDPESGLVTLQTRPAPQSSLTQRAGRAGRVGPGLCVRLFDEGEFRTRPSYDRPELETADCAGPALLLAAMGISDPPFLDPPPAARWEAAISQLKHLGALKPDGRVTEKGERMAAMPLHPRTAAMLLEGKSRQVSYRAATMAALIEERSWRKEEPDFWFSLRWMLDNTDARSAEPIGEDRTTLRAIVRSAERLLKTLGAADEPARVFDEERGDLEACLLTAFADRLGRVSVARLQTVDGTTFELPADAPADVPFAVVLAAKGPLGRQKAISIASISEDSVLEVFLDRFEERRTFRYDAKLDRLFERSALYLGEVEIESTEQVARPGEQAGAALEEVVQKRGRGGVLDVDAMQTLRRRLELLSFDRETIDADIGRVLQQCCATAISLADIRGADPLSIYRYGLPSEVQKALDEKVPLSIDLPGRPRTEVHYELERPPWAAAYLQEFFGLSQTPRIGSEPLTLHLWAPNGRAVQVTSDLAGFWERHYPSIRRELSRRYPKHHWPEDPLAAKAVRFKRQV